MKILVSNDDGIQAEGLVELAKALRKLGEVTVVAPALPQSGKGHSMTLFETVKVERRNFPEGIEAYALWGTPRDCVDLGIDLFCPDADLVVTGINEGRNICNDCVASGTVGGATRAYQREKPAIAVSLDFGNEYDYARAARQVLPVIEWYCSLEGNKNYLLNVNIPNAEEIKGVKFCDNGGKHTYDISYKKIHDDGKNMTFAVSYDAGPFRTAMAEDLEHDMYALKEGYMVISPQDDNLVRKDMLEPLRELWDRR